MTDTVRFSIPDAVFASVPRKQPPRNYGLTDHRFVGDEELVELIERGVAKRALDATAVRLLRSLSAQVAASLVNAGPHVIDLRVRVDYDREREGHRITCSSPMIATRTYGPEVARADLHVRERGERVAPVEPPAPWWRRLVAAVSDFAKPLEYDGPRGRIDA